MENVTWDVCSSFEPAKMAGERIVVYGLATAIRGIGIIPGVQPECIMGLFKVVLHIEEYELESRSVKKVLLIEGDSTPGTIVDSGAQKEDGVTLPSLEVVKSVSGFASLL